MTGAQQLTPTGREIAERHRAFHAKIAARAVPDTGIGTRQKFGEKVVVPIVPADPWRDRQERLHQIAAAVEAPLAWPWFSIVADKPVASIHRPPSIKEIQTASALFFGFKRGELLNSRRTRVITRPRHIAYFLCSDMTNKSLPEIGRHFADRDHTTILYGVRKIERQMLTDAKLASDVQSVRDLIVVRA